MKVKFLKHSKIRELGGREIEDIENE